ncbi:MAG: deoxyribodipyrimidine photo-lyase [Pseudomonadota bacterium]
MTSPPIHGSRIRRLNDSGLKKGRYVLYWMQQSQRAEYNHALEYAVQEANALGQGVLVAFGIMDDYPEANLRHYRFMLEGLRETRIALANRGIQMVIQRGDPADITVALGQKASFIVCDRGYLRHQKAWRHRVALSAPCRVVQVESDVLVPVEVVSGKAEYGARTIRPKIHRHLKDYLVPLKAGVVKTSSLGLKVRTLDLNVLDVVINKLTLDRSVGPVTRFFRGGTTSAKEMVNEFIKNRFHRYGENRNQPQTDDISQMSPYLHFGQISPLYLALQIEAAAGSLEEAKAVYLEELIVRRELTMNFVHYTPDYDTYTCLPSWAQKTLAQHRTDPREYRYNRNQLEAAQTHDAYWNAAMREMKATGFMHSYMRMYWGKKILEWSESPEDAFQSTLALNNKYFLDGRDPNSYAGVAWVFGVHDRAWFERPIFGKVRYMAASGLERKCDIRGYVKKVDALEASAES